MIEGPQDGSSVGGLSCWASAARGCCWVVAVSQVVGGSCEDDDSSSSSSSSGQSRQSYEDGKCWYELWYFWFIVALVFVTVSILILFFCKQQVKRSTGRQGRRCTPVLTMPIAPPQYEIPGHQPPPYHIAISSPPISCCPPTGTRCPIFQPYEACVLPPGYVGGQEQDDGHHDSMSVTSVTSVGARSNPPPYSPPRCTYRPCHCGEHQNHRQ